MECRRTLGQIVVPVFYDVDPSDVRRQTGTFATAFLKHEQQFDEVKEKLQLWRDALTEAANLSGFDVGNTDRDEAESIMGIVANIIKVLPQRSAVGIHSRGWSARGNGGLFLPGNEIPSWFTPVDPQGEIVLPQSFGCDFKALTVCVIYSSDNSQSSGFLRIRVANYTQNTVFLISPMRATVITCHENCIWLGHLSNNKLNVKGGDKINVGVGPATTDDIHVRLKKIGINLEKEKLIREYAQEEGSHKAEHRDDSSHENQSRKRLKSDSSVERNPEETDEIMQERRSMG